ncbi:MAG: AAA family ATPase [Clostridia bacterium]|nr:AAA family ATPase [Clostridia bacterium]
MPGDDNDKMITESFEREMLRELESQYRRYPAMQPEDTVKFIFQSMLGVGHILSDRATVTRYIENEMAGLEANPEEPLFEVLSPAWCRLNLRRATAEHIQPSVIAGMMTASGFETRFSRKDAADVFARFAETKDQRFREPDLTDVLLNEEKLPSHSAVYHDRYHPAYRVVSTFWLRCITAVRAVADITAGTGRRMITIDGPCASGKTTLADRLAAVFDAAVVHTDDFVVPHAMKTKERLAVPGGNCDDERLAGEVAEPFKNGESVRYRRYDCAADRLLDEETLPDCRLLILEGCYCNLPSVRRYADLRLFVSAPEKTRMERLKKRETPESLRRFGEMWIPLENAYFSAFGLPDDGSFVIE